MADSAVPQPEVEKPQGEDFPSVNSSASQTLPTQTSSANAISNMDENPKVVASSGNAQRITNTISKTFSQGLVILKNIFFEELPSPLQERFSLLTKNFRKKGHQFFRVSVVRTYMRCMDDFVDTSGSIVRRLQRVVETETLCLPTCPYLQHYTNCPLSSKPLCSPISESEEPVEDEDAVKKSSSAEILKKEPEREMIKQEESSSEANQNYSATPQELLGLNEDQKPLTTNAFVQGSSLEKLFSFAFTWLVLYPVNTLVALLNFQRSLTHDLDDYFQMQSGYVTAVGRRVLSPRRVIRSRLLARAKTLLKEVLQLSAGDRTMPFKLSLDPNLGTLRAQPVYENRKATLKRKISLDDLTESFMSDNELHDDDYEPSTSSQSSSTDSNDASITVSEHDLSVHEEDGLLALKDEVKEEALKNPESPNPPALKLEPLQIEESQC